MKAKIEYPRPQLVRKEWYNLNGIWEFEFDDNNKGIDEKWYDNGKKMTQKINVPFVYQAQLSGIEERTPHDIVWYKKKIELKYRDGFRTILHFGAVDYAAWIYVNGKLAKEHIGGYTPFSVDITPYMSEDMQEITVRVYDPHKEEFIPRGKQFWEKETRGIWYTNSTGIWQTVWVENVPIKHIEKVKFTPLFDEGKVEVECKAENVDVDDILSYRIKLGEETIMEGNLFWKSNELKFCVDVIRSKIFNTNFHEAGIAWTPENPVLFDVELLLMEKEGKICDEVSSYFGFRKIHTENGMVYLNNKPYYQKLILDQGYWPAGLLTAPDDEALKQDILIAKGMGFNGCRKHQKVENPRFLYWADYLGFLVWGESASTAMYSSQSVKKIMDEWCEIVDRDYNHPCIVAWVPVNESWGVPEIARNPMQQSFSLALYHLLHAIDGTRVVISNDGWEMTKTDICAIHNYRHGQCGEKEIYEEYQCMLSTKENLIKYPSTCREIYAHGFQYSGEPIMLTEFGGIGFDVSGENGWGYTSVESEEEFVEDYARIMDAVYRSKGLWGFCYTQLTDVEQEINGLYTYDRKAKCNPERIKEINNRYHISRIVE